MNEFEVIRIKSLIIDFNFGGL